MKKNRLVQNTVKRKQKKRTEVKGYYLEYILDVIFLDILVCKFG